MRITTWRRWTDLPLLILAVGSLPLLLLELVSDRLTQSDRNFVFGVNVAVFIAFAISYGVEIFLSESRVKCEEILNRETGRWFQCQ